MSQSTRPFEILFLTNFSDSCFQVIPALAQLSDEVDTRLTILHAHDGGPAKEKEAKLRSFFPEADTYDACRRALVSASPLEAVRQIHQNRPIDLLVAPAGDPLGVPRLGHNSFRSRLIRETGLPVWTSGAGTAFSRLVRPTKNVVCCLDLEHPARHHQALAEEYANCLGAQLHVVQILPDIHEGNLVDLARGPALYRNEPTRRPRPGTMPKFHVTDRSRLAKTLDACDADIAFLDGARWMSRRWLTLRMRRQIDMLPCPAVCVDGAEGQVTWSLSRNQTRRPRPLVSEVVRQRMVDRLPAPERVFVTAGEPALP